MRGQKRVEDARKRAYDPRIHLLRKKSFEAGWIAGSRPGNDGSLWFDVNASRFSSLLRPLKALAREVPLLRHDAFISNHKPVIAGLDVPVRRHGRHLVGWPTTLWSRCEQRFAPYQNRTL